MQSVFQWLTWLIYCFFLSQCIKAFPTCESTYPGGPCVILGQGSAVKDKLET